MAFPSFIPVDGRREAIFIFWNENVAGRKALRPCARILPLCRSRLDLDVKPVLRSPSTLSFVRGYAQKRDRWDERPLKVCTLGKKAGLNACAIAVGEQIDLKIRA
jgi:hypothetical protein